MIKISLAFIMLADLSGNYDCTKATFPKEDFKRYASLKSFSYKDCKDSMHQFELPDGTRFVFTNEDDCDGGNSYGLVYRKDKVVALINDSNFYEERPQRIRPKGKK